MTQPILQRQIVKFRKTKYLAASLEVQAGLFRAGINGNDLKVENIHARSQEVYHLPAN